VQTCTVPPAGFEPAT